MAGRQPHLPPSPPSLSPLPPPPPLHVLQSGECIRKTYESLVAKRVIVPAPEPEAPKVPMDYTWAKKLGTTTTYTTYPTITPV